jgi:ABC-type lipoprotein export system ATPase subunit
VIRLDQVTRSYRTAGHDAGVLRGIDLEVAAGELLAITGRSGSGKTTLLNIMGGLDSGYQGVVEVAGLELGGLSDRQLARHRGKHIGFMFQTFQLLEGISCLDNVLLPFQFAVSPWDREGARSRACQVLEAVGLGDRLGARPAELSGGEMQRVALARALLRRPSLVICDELTGNLDDRTGAAILEVLQGYRDETGATLVVATHDPAVIDAADRVLCLEEGRLRAADEAGSTP